MPKRREAKLDLCGDNNIGDLKCLVGMIWLNHLITYITTAACSAVCQWCARTCVCFQSSPLCISICACLCSGKQALKSYDWPRSVCLNTWWLKRFMSTKGPTWDSFFFFVRRMAKVHSHAVHTNSFISICDYEQNLSLLNTKSHSVWGLLQYNCQWEAVVSNGRRRNYPAGIVAVAFPSRRLSQCLLWLWLCASSCS